MSSVPFFLGPIASLFWLDSELCSDVHLDGILQLEKCMYTYF